MIVQKIIFRFKDIEIYLRYFRKISNNKVIIKNYN